MIVPPHIAQIKSLDDFKKFLADADAGARYTASEFLRVGKSKWIARALQEGWSDVLRSLVYQIAKRDKLRYGDFPNSGRLDGLVINRDDHEAYKRVGTSSKRIMGSDA